MTWRITHSYPFLFAIIPVVRLVVENPGWMTAGDAAVIVATVLAACGWCTDSSCWRPAGGAPDFAP